MKYIKDKSIDMILCDLPYGTTQCKWDTIIPFDKLWEQYNRIIKDNGVICLFGSEPFASYLRLSNIKDYKYDWVWEKSKATNFLNAKKQPLRKIEIISVFYKKQPIYNPQMIQGEPYERGFRSDKYSDKNRDSTTGTYGSTFIGSEDGKRYPVNKIYFKTAESEGKILHPTQKPVDLMEYLINTYTNENDLILDFTCGSGTTLVASKKLKRKTIGIELEEKYCEIAKNRLLEVA
jgi:site-specific DNA-methyltransferase (adenine-specific)/modification methylase